MGGAVCLLAFTFFVVFSDYCSVYCGWGLAFCKYVGLWFLSVNQIGFQPLLSGAAYRPFGQGVLGWNWDSFSGQVQFDYDLNGRVSRIQDDDDRQYVRNAKGWVLGISDPITPTADQVYTYNDVGNLKQADLAARPDPINYNLDKNSNITYKTVGPLWMDANYIDMWTN